MSKPRYSRRRFLQTAAAVGVASGAGIGSVRAADSKVLKVRSYGDLQILDPAHRISAPDDDLMGAIFEKLVEYKPGDNFEWELQGATAIEQVDPTHVKFVLRPGMTWTNGFGEVTAEDVKFSYERIADPANESAYRDDWALLDHVEVVDKHTGVIVLKEPFAPLFWSTLPYGSGCIVSKAAIEALPEKKFTTQPPATCGPYVVKEWAPKQKTVLVRNPDYNGPKPDFDEVQVFPIEDAKAAELAFESGELDATGIAMSSVPRLRDKMIEGAELTVRPALRFWWLGISFVHPQLQDPRIRKAIQYAVDTQGILSAAFFGVAERSTGIIAPSLLGHRERNIIDKPDLGKARALLAEAGVGDGLKLSLDCLNTQEYTSAAQVVQASLAQIGIELELRPADSGTFWTLGFDESPKWKDIQLLLISFSMAPDPSWATVWFTPEQIGKWNWERFNSPEYGELHKQALVELDNEKRAALYVRMQDLMEESGSYLFLTHGVNAHVYRDTVVPGLRADGQNNMYRKFRLA